MCSRHLGHVVVVALTFALALSVSAQPGDGDPKEVVVTEKNNKTTVKVAKGTTLAIKLEALPSAGYTWQSARTDAAVLPFSGKVETEKPKAGAIGAKVLQ